VNDLILSALGAIMSTGLVIWCLRDGEAAIGPSFPQVHRETHPKIFRAMIACYAALALICGVLFVSQLL
jgi:hypothetical protein